MSTETTRDATEGPTTSVEPATAAPLTPPAVEVHDLTVSYDKRPVLWNVDLALPEGELIGVIGPNGAGKKHVPQSALGVDPR